MSNRRLKIVIAPNAFKECLTSKQAAAAIKKGVLKAYPAAEIEQIPLADGGDGMLSAFLSIKKGRLIKTSAFNPLFKKIPTSYAILDDGTAVIEMALISGLNLIRPVRGTAVKASSFGLGQLIIHAAKMGCRKFIIGIGGSASTDGGAGIAQAAGYRLLDKKGNDIPPGGIGLSRLSKIIDSPEVNILNQCSFKVACDVANPLLGKKGAAAVFSPQKGASKSEIIRLESNLKHLADLAEKKIGKICRNKPGSGAAGGSGFMLTSLFRGALISGSDLILSESGFEDKCRNADLILTAEGILDGQSEMGKLIYAISRIGQKRGIPVTAFAGSLGPGWERLYKHGLTSAFSIAQGPMTLKESMLEARPLLTSVACSAVKMFCRT